MLRKLRYTRILILTVAVSASALVSGSWSAFAAPQQPCVSDTGECATAPPIQYPIDSTQPVVPAPLTQPQPVPDPIVPPTMTPFQPPSGGGLQLGGAGLLASSSVPAVSPGYIDPAMIRSQFRLRYDSAFGNNFPDRAEFFYAACGCGGGPGPGNPGNPPSANDDVDFQELRAYLELASDNQFSVFAELPFRFIDPGVDGPAANTFGPTGETGGIGDVEAGFRYSLINSADTLATFQLRGYFPTGDARRGLGTDHVSLEPALLYQEQLSNNAFAVAELRDWIPISGTPGFSGNVLRYGVGLGYTIDPCAKHTITPIAELVGWSVLDGQQTNLDAVGGRIGGNALESARTTIVNAKIGVRIGLGDNGNPLLDGGSVYVGYGRSLTGSRWYEDIFRLEYQMPIR